MFDIVIVVHFQSIFYLKIYKIIFLFLNFIFDINTSKRTKKIYKNNNLK
jgi:hypothetical protein